MADSGSAPGSGAAPPIAVRTPPGQIALARMPAAANSAAIVLVSAMTPALATA